MIDREPTARQALDRAIRRIRVARTLDDLLPEWEEVEQAIRRGLKSATRHRRGGGRLKGQDRADLEALASEVIPKFVAMERQHHAALTAAGADVQVRHELGAMLGFLRRIREALGTDVDHERNDT